MESEVGIVTISDRMLTSADIEFEPDQTKFYPLRPSNSVALVSGSIDLHVSLVNETLKKITEDDIKGVEKVAEIFSENFKSLRRKRAETIYLSPLGLDASSFIAQHALMNADVARNLTNRLLESELELSVIIAGLGSDGWPHIFSVQDPGILICHDGIGFYAVGSGARQFESLFMSERYTRVWKWYESMLITYFAKKKAESSPGVGKGTDMFFISKEGIEIISDQEIEALEGYYNESEKAAATKRDRVLERMVKDARFIGEEEPQGQKEKQERSSSEQK